MNKSLRLLGLIKKAGLLAAGDETVYTAARGFKAKAVLSAADASDASKKRADRYARESGGVYIILPYTKAELGAVVGRGLPGILAVLDAGFAAALAEKLETEYPNSYREAAARLLKEAMRLHGRKKDAPAENKTAGVGKRRTAQ